LSHAPFWAEISRLQSTAAPSWPALLPLPFPFLSWPASRSGRDRFLALVAEPDGELYALGAFMKLDLPEYYEAMRVSHRLHKRTIRAVGHPKDNPDQDFRVYSRRFEAASIKSGYAAAASRMNELHKPLCELAEQALRPLLFSLL
jgi:hypothetical protein